MDFQGIKISIQQIRENIEERFVIFNQEINEKFDILSSDTKTKIHQVRKEFHKQYTTLQAAMEENISKIRKQQKVSWVISGVVIIVLVCWNIWLTM